MKIMQTTSPFPPVPVRLERSRGDISIIFTLLILLVILMGAMVIVSVVSVSLQRVRDVAITAQALYAADTGIERAYASYAWDTDQENAGPTCLNVSGAVIPGAAGAEYRLDVKGAIALCPTLEEVNTGGDALCVTATGRVGAIQRKIQSDTKPLCGPS